jgi:hypothetical protein
MWRAIKFVSRVIGLYCVAILAQTSALATPLQFHFEGEFSSREQAQLIAWIEQTDRSLTALVGQLPFTRHIYFHRLANAREPVPWAHTQRRPQQGVHFHVDPSFPQAEFVADWTAPHELSHLVLPYLGERNAWLAEGFASYMQYQVMAEMGVLDPVELDERYTQKFQRAEGRFDLSDLPFADAAPELRQARQFPTMYWGGAVYFWQLDRWLALHTDADLTSVLRSYINCCRAGTTHLRQLIDHLDRITNQQIFGTYLSRFETQPGFPDYRTIPRLPVNNG